MTKHILSLITLVLAMSISSIALVLAMNVSSTKQAQPRIAERIFDAEPGQRVELNLKFGDRIVIHGWDRDEVSFRATVEVNAGRLNDALLIDFGAGSVIRVDVDFDKDLIKKGKAEDCPGRKYSHFNDNRNRHDEGYVVCSDIVYEIYLPVEADLHVESISANIELAGLLGPVSARSISGFVDMSWAGRDGAELSIKTITGGAYTDLENIEFNNKKKQMSPVGYEIRGKVGNGGTPVRLESISGDIYVRSQVL